MMLLAVVVAAQGQGRGRPWKRGLLHVEDFGVTAATGQDNSHLDYGIVYTPAGVTEGTHTYLFCRTSAVMYPTASWMAEGHTDDAELTYNQTLFDLVEVYRRQMQQEAMMLSKKAEYERLLSITMDHLEREMQTLRVATEAGRDSLSVERIRVKNLEWLNDNPCGRPLFEPNRYWWNVSLEYGVAFPTGDLARHCTAAIGTQGLTASIGWGRHGLFYRLMTGDVRTYDTLEYWATPNLYRTDLSFGYGFTVLDRPSFNLTPYVGYGVTDLDWWVGENYTFGVTGCYHFHHWHRVSNAAKGKAKCFSTSALANIFLTYTNFGENSDRNGRTIGLQLGFNFRSRSERVVW